MHKDEALTKTELQQMQPLALAYVGDAVFELYIRRFLLTGHYKNVNDLHRQAIEYVKAGAQTDILRRIGDCLTPDELDIVRRGRNANPHTVPKNADISDYRYATGFEALIGYLYLEGNDDRLYEILKMCEERGDTDEQE